VKKALMEMLACPICKHHPLDLHVFHEDQEVVEGVIVCTQCHRWYPIIEEIPYMLPDELRDGKDDLPFLRKWKARFPHEVLREGRPFNAASV
jgi:uncharacterized protein YbaR (Trm112 family)